MAFDPDDVQAYIDSCDPNDAACYSVTVSLHFDNRVVQLLFYAMLKDGWMAGCFGQKLFDTRGE
eukprot:scaffold403103_cov52-Attheya_sp.AAC.2